MQPPTYCEIIRQLLSEGFAERLSKGDHRRFSKDGHKVTVRDQGAKHSSWKEWQSIKAQTGWE